MTEQHRPAPTDASRATRRAIAAAAQAARTAATAAAGATAEAASHAATTADEAATTATTAATEAATAVQTAVQTAATDAAEAAAEAAQAVDDAIDRLTGVPVEDGAITRFDASGAELVLEERGAGDPLFLLIHGIGMGRKVFADLGARLAAHGRVWAIDQPGYGEAAEPPRTPTMERSADLLAQLLRSRGAAGAVVIGHSMGSQVALELAVRHPDLVSRLVLAGPTVDASARSGLVQVARLARDLLIESPRVLLLGGREYLRAGPHLRGKMRAMLVHRPEAVAGRVAVPTLILRGEKDYVSPREWNARLAALVPDARTHEIAGHGHETFIRDATPAAERILAFAPV